MSCEGKSRRLFVRLGLIAVVLLGGGVVCFASAQAFAFGSLHVSVATGLTQRQVVTVTGSGLAANAYGYVLECNDTPGEPTVSVGPPFDQSVPVAVEPTVTQAHRVHKLLRVVVDDLQGPPEQKTGTSMRSPAGLRAL